MRKLAVTALLALAGIWVPTGTGSAQFVDSLAATSAYDAYFGTIGRGVSLRSLPPAVRSRLAPHLPDAFLEGVRYGATDRIRADVAMTDCRTIYVRAEGGEAAAMGSAGSLFSERHRDVLELLLHELVHARQCTEMGGREAYARRWFGVLPWTTITTILVDRFDVSARAIHDQMPLEQNAGRRARSLLVGLLGYRMVVSGGGSGSWRDLTISPQRLSDLRLGDFDGDGRADVIRADGSGWYLSSAGTGDWRRLRRSPIRVERLAFGDFDGDGRADVFRADGTRWYVSHGGAGEWSPLGASSERVEDLGFGDFDGDGRTDVFRADGTRWQVSHRGRSRWRPLARSQERVEDLAFGDFDGDGRTDVFRADGSTWYVSDGGTGEWRTLARSSERVEDLAFGDFDGDGRTDVFRADGVGWHVSYGGTGDWRPLAASPVPLDRLRFGDLDGDGHTDVFTLVHR